MVHKCNWHQDGNQTTIFVTVDCFMIRPFLKYVIIIGDSEDIGKKSLDIWNLKQGDTQTLFIPRWQSY